METTGNNAQAEEEERLRTLYGFLIAILLDDSRVLTDFRTPNLPLSERKRMRNWVAQNKHRALERGIDVTIEELKSRLPGLTPARPGTYEISQYPLSLSRKRSRAADEGDNDIIEVRRPRTRSSFLPLSKASSP